MPKISYLINKLLKITQEKAFVPILTMMCVFFFFFLTCFWTEKCRKNIVHFEPKNNYKSHIGLNPLIA